jgi:mannose-6-phosphate isomerase-like protein (cupin superfamily)
MTEKVMHGGRLLAMIIRKDFGGPGVEFITPDHASLQVGVLIHAKAATIQPHAHKPNPRTVTDTQEVLFIRKGRLRVDFYDEGKAYLESRIVGEGDALVLISGGHGFEALEDVEIIEAKTGPYAGEDDKERFDADRPEKSIIPD